MNTKTTNSYEKITCKLRHCEFFHLTGSISLIPVIVPIYLKEKELFLPFFQQTDKSKVSDPRKQSDFLMLTSHLNQGLQFPRSISGKANSNLNA